MAFLDAINPQTLMERVRPLIGERSRTTLLTGGAAAAAVVIAAAFWFLGASYAVLYAGLSGEEGGRAIAELQKLNIPYRITEGGRVIQVPASEVGRARLQLAARGVAKKDADEWAILDNESLGVSPFVEQVHYVRGVETALSRTVGEVDGVVSAKVKLALPKETSFLGDSPKPSGSVLLRLRPGTTLTAAQVTGIVGLVASSVPGLARDRVTVVDQSGTVLNPNGEGGALQAPQQLELTREVNRRYETLITDLLVPVLGRGNFRISSDADIDFSQSKESLVRYGHLQAIEDKFADIGSRIRVMRQPGPFNFSALNNRAVREAARGDYICLLNNDAAPLDAAWLGEMMELARRPEVGVVGAKLTYPDGRIQHGGVVLGVGYGAPADHPYNGEPGNSIGYWGRMLVTQGFSAVTAACCMTRRAVWEELGGFDEADFAVCYNDVDYCLRTRAAGYLVVWTPHARLLHDTSVSQRANVEQKAVEERNARFAREKLAMFGKWMPQIAYDPAYNRNLSSFGTGFAVEVEGAPTWDPDFRPRGRVLVYCADREGCGEYRIIAPSRALFKSGLVHTFETMRLMTPPEVARIAPDSIVFQRQLEPGQIEIVRWVKETSKALRVFELDDLITNLPPKSAHRPNIAADIGERIKEALALCDRFVCSTEPMARAYGKFCGETVVMPNRLEKARWLGLNPGRRDGKPRVGWAGAIGHMGDLAVIAPVVEATAKDIDWVFLGMCPDGLKRHVAEFHPWVELHDYAAKLASLDLDLAVAPLEYHPFNEAKSNLRLLEYGVLGYPVLCTDILPYQGDLPVARTRNKPRDWIRAIRDLVADRDGLRQTGDALRQAVVRDWMLEDHLDAWKRAWLP